MTTMKPIAREDEAVTGIREDGRAFIRFERRLAHPVERVWRAVSDAPELETWLAHRAEIEPRPGGRFALWLSEVQSPNVEEYRVTAIEPPHLLEVESTGTEGTLRFELRADGDGSVLTFTDVRPAGETAQHGIVAGWHIRMEQLPEALAGRPTDWAALDASRDERGVVARIMEIYRHYDESRSR